MMQFYSSQNKSFCLHAVSVLSDFPVSYKFLRLPISSVRDIFRFLSIIYTIKFTEN